MAHSILNRNTDGAGRNKLAGFEGYFAHQAHWMAQLRRSASKARFVRHSQRVWSYVKAKLRESWSPEQIAGRMKDDFPEDAAMRISHETIYAWVYEEKHQGASCGNTCVNRATSVANVTAVKASGE